STAIAAPAHPRRRAPPKATCTRRDPRTGPRRAAARRRARASRRAPRREPLRTRRRTSPTADSGFRRRGTRVPTVCRPRRRPCARPRSPPRSWRKRSRTDSNSAPLVSPEQRLWWQRVALVFWRPREVFAGLRSTDEDDEAARQEPVLLIVILAGMAGIVLSPGWRELLDQPDVDALAALVLTFVGGAAEGAFASFPLPRPLPP